MHFQADDIDWQCPAGLRLDELAQRLPSSPPLELTVFGSTPLQLLVEPRFLSADIDVFADEQSTERLIRFLERQGWSAEKSGLYIQICEALAFRTTTDWQSRAIRVERHGHIFRFVHPWDVLVSKLQRRSGW